MGRLVCFVKINGEDSLRVLTTAPNINLAAFVRTQPGVGKPFWFWPMIDGIPPLKLVAADFTNAPISSSDVAVNAANIAAITATPEEVLTLGEAE